MAALILAILAASRPHTMLPTNATERTVWATWFAYVLSFLSLSWVANIAWGLDPGKQYSALCALAGMAFFVSGSLTWGGCYVLGLVFFVAAPLLAFFPEQAAVMYGALWGVSLGSIGIHYRRRSPRLVRDA
jgi:hypothetical protein